MKSLTRIWSIALMALSFSSVSFAQSDLIIDDLGIIDLKANSASLKFNYNYPGMNDGGFSATDCLMFVSSGVDFQLPDDALQKFAAGLKITDGSGNLFPGGEINLLTPVITNRRLVFYIIDLSKFVTGIEVTTQNGSSLKALVESAVGADYPHFVGLQMVRSCRLLPQ